MANWARESYVEGKACGSSSSSSSSSPSSSSSSPTPRESSTSASNREVLPSLNIALESSRESTWPAADGGGAERRGMEGEVKEVEGVKRKNVKNKRGKYQDFERKKYKTTTRRATEMITDRKWRRKREREKKLNTIMSNAVIGGACARVRRRPERSHVSRGPCGTRGPIDCLPKRPFVWLSLSGARCRSPEPRRPFSFSLFVSFYCF